MDADSHTDRPGAQGFLSCACCVDGSAWLRERDEERIPLGVDLHAAVAGERSAQDPAVLEQGRAVGIHAELVQQLCRALHVGEEKRDGSGG